MSGEIYGIALQFRTNYGMQSSPYVPRKKCIAFFPSDARKTRRVFRRKEKRGGIARNPSK